MPPMKSGSDNCAFGRREFLGASAMSLLGYTLSVSVPEARADSAAKSPLGREIEAKTRGKFFDFSAEPNMSKEELGCDVMVAGGGLAGICAALAAARNGAKTVLVQDRSRLGGNSSSEIKMHPLGVNGDKWGWREAGIIEEIKLDNAANNPQRSWEMWDLLLYDKCVTEPNLTLLLDTSVYAADAEGGRISAAYARCDKTLKIYRIKSKIYIDCTGDSRLAMEAGAELMAGREGSEKYGEPLADTYEKGKFLCSSIMFTSKDCGRPVAFKAPAWAKKISAEDLKLRDPAKWGFDYGYWFISHGGMADTIRDNEVIRFELLSIVLGVWNYIKNSGKYPEAANRAIDFVGMIPGKRDSYRIVGERVFTQRDIEKGWESMPDQVGAVGWPLEDQTSEGFYARGKKPAIYGGQVPFYNLPLSIMCAKGFSNLMMAGRNMSASHLAFTSTRVMNSCSVAGQAAGTAAAMCARENLAPREISASGELAERLRQNLLKDGQIILGAKNSDPLDLARAAKISATDSAEGTKPENVVSGMCYDIAGSNGNRWKAPIEKSPALSLEWGAPQKIGKLILNLDTGSRLLTPTLETGFVKRVIQGPQPEALRDFTISATLADGSKRILADVRGNYQKRLVFDFEPADIGKIEIKCLATNGAPQASIFEVRAYGA